MHGLYCIMIYNIAVTATYHITRFKAAAVEVIRAQLIRVITHEGFSLIIVGEYIMTTCRE